MIIGMWSIIIWAYLCDLLRIDILQPPYQSHRHESVQSSLSFYLNKFWVNSIMSVEKQEFRVNIEYIKHFPKLGKSNALLIEANYSYSVKEYNWKEGPK